MLKQRFICAKRKLFDKLYDHLNPQQRQAVFTVNGPLLILAGAGSGKTTVLVNRIGYMIRYGNSYFSEDLPSSLTDVDVSQLEEAISLNKEQIADILDLFAVDPIAPWSILSITFTNKAANEMKSRLELQVGEKALSIRAGTFHSVCVRLLRQFSEISGYGTNFTIYDSDDSKKLIAKVLKENNLDEKQFQPKTILNYISNAKNRLLTPSDYEKEAVDFREKQISKLYFDYQNSLKKANALDFDDIIMQMVRLLKESTEVRHYCNERFKYVCVDEYQDTNYAQFELTRLISEKYNNLMVVGDDDQSIYKFRGADIDNILNFDKNIAGVKIIKLEQNYRSTKHILDVANEVISHNKGRLGKTLWTAKEGGRPIVVKQLQNQNDETRFIIEEIINLRNKKNVSLNEIAILYRINALSNTFENAFAKSGIPYRILGNLRFYERKEIKDVLAYLCVINNPADNLRLIRIINEPKRKLGDTTVNAILALAERHGKSMFDIMKDADSYPPLVKAAAKLKEFTALILGLQELSVAEPVSVLIEHLLELSGYRQMLILQGIEGKDRLENVSEIISNAVAFEEKKKEENKNISEGEPESKATLSAFLEEVALVSDIDNYDQNAAAVVLMTIHSAKGLEFPYVFLPAFEESIFPSMQSLAEDLDAEEERRLAYVAITRAKESLYCTHVKERLLYGKTAFNPISRFLDEIPREMLEWQKLEGDRASSRTIYRSGSAQRTHTYSNEFLKKPNLDDIGSVKSSKPQQNYYKVGDSVRHPVFGDGLVVTVINLGADMMYEISFDSIGTKKMMANYAKLTPIKK